MNFQAKYARFENRNEKGITVGQRGSKLNDDPIASDGDVADPFAAAAPFEGGTADLSAGDPGDAPF